MSCDDSNMYPRPIQASNVARIYYLSGHGFVYYNRSASFMSGQHRSSRGFRTEQEAFDAAKSAGFSYIEIADIDNLLKVTKSVRIPPT